MRTLQTRNLRAIKPHKYGTRHLTAGEEYEVPLRDAVALVVSRKAQFVAETSPRPPGKLPPPSPPVRAVAPEPAVAAAVERMESLRAEAERLGIEVDGRWGTIRLQQEIAKARA
jgi:hypothetical protein